MEDARHDARGGRACARLSESASVAPSRREVFSKGVRLAPKSVRLADAGARQILQLALVLVRRQRRCAHQYAMRSDLLVFPDRAGRVGRHLQHQEGDFYLGEVALGFRAHRTQVTKLGGKLRGRQTERHPSVAYCDRILQRALAADAHTAGADDDRWMRLLRGLGKKLDLGKADELTLEAGFGLGPQLF